MTDRSTILRIVLAAGVLGLFGACGTPGRNVPVEIGPAPAPLPSQLVAREIGRLLSADPDESRRAERRLTTLDDAGRKALVEHAATIPLERDPRWLNVLDENHALIPLAPDEEVEYLLWKVSREEPFYVMKAQGRLLELARTNPDLLLRRLDQGGRGAEAVAVALALVGEMRAFHPLLARYRNARSLEERRVASEALAHLAGEDRRPRLQGTPLDIERDAKDLEDWYAKTQERGGDE